jgi:ribosome-associated translation inhibitor RaiA
MCAPNPIIDRSFNRGTICPLTIARAVCHRLLAKDHAEEKSLKEQWQAMDDRLQLLRDQFDGLLSAKTFPQRLRRLVKPALKRFLKDRYLGQNSSHPEEWDASVENYFKDRRVFDVTLKHKSGLGSHYRVEVVMPGDFKANCVEREKLMVSAAAIEKQRSAVAKRLDKVEEKLERELYDIICQQQAEAFLASLPKKTLAKLKAIIKA